MDAAARIELLRDSSDFTALTRYTKTFDLFRVMGVSSKELVHSNIIASFMNANEAHGLGSRFRDAFVETLLQRPCVGPALSQAVLESTPGAPAKVARELAHLDVLIDFPTLRLVIAIENKIWAADQDKQIEGYQEALCTLYPHYQSRALVYLTPTGRESPTVDRNSSVPVYYMSYGELAALLGQHQTLATPPAAHFIGEFITHVEKTMSGNTELSQLCWKIFEQNQEAYEYLVKHHEYCMARKVTELFQSMQDRVRSDPLFEKWTNVLEIRASSNLDKAQHDLDIRLMTWPSGVWVKIYKHSWFGVYPFFRSADKEALMDLLPAFTQPARMVHGIEGRFFASTRFLEKSDRCVRKAGDRINESDVNIALTRAHDCISEINDALLHATKA